MCSIPKGKFTFPLTEEDQKQFVGNDKVCVVGIIGKSAFEAKDCKAAAVDRLLRRIIFQASVGGEDGEKNVGQMDGIEGYYDEKNHTMYLHMVGIFDTHRLVATCRSLSAELETKGFLHLWAEMKYSQAKALLFLFSVSHVIMIVHPVPTFDVSYVHLFRTIDGIRQKAQVHLSEVLKECPVSDDWVQAGRPCSPRALFVFQSQSCEALEDTNKNLQGSRQARKFPPIKKLEHALEDQIYRILRKSRVITNISMNSLFAIPANQEFVYVHTPESQTSDAVTYLMRQLRAQCLSSLDDGCSAKAKDQTGSVEVNGTSTVAAGLGNREVDHSFKTFLEQHLELAFTKGFDDNVGRHSGMSVFELPTSKTWYTVANALYKLFFTNDPSSAVTKDVLCALRSQIDVDGRFSEARCLKVLPVAAAAYQEGLPSHYSSEIHHSQLSQAYRMFSLHARGPAFERYALQLHEECEKFWKNGHQLCEVHSLTGNPCLKSIHRLPTDPEEPDPADGRPLLPVMSHCSQIKLTSACNCGRKQGGRDDPFDTKAANYDFYDQLVRVCCNQLESHTFPVFQPSTADFKAAKIAVTQWSTAAVAKQNVSCSGREERILSIVPGMSLALSLGQSLGTSGEDIDGGQLSLHPDPSPEEMAKIEGILSVSELTAACAASDKEDKTLIRQMSTTEYLPGMLHSESPAGLLPSFSSWSLLCLGPSSLYSHNIGIQDQPGFITSTNFLLPWDVTVKTDNREKWPTIAETSGKKGHSLKGKKGGRDSSEFTVKIFLGIEYECPRGHRFMCSAPEKILKATGLGLVKENAGKITSNDMPLYFPCPCRSGKPIIAQLMRIHVVTPKAPVHVTLDPKIQPAPPPCPVFYPGNQEPVKLSQSTYWVLRLPFIYEGDQGPYLPPKDKKIPIYGKLLKGMFNVLQITSDK